VSAIRVEPRALVVDGLTVRYGGVTAVDRVSLRVAPGEILGLIGPNGAGKSSFIDALSGFARIASGSVLVGDTNITRLGAHQRVGAGLVRSWQSVEVFNDITVRENLQVAQGQAGWQLGLRGAFVAQPLALSDAAAMAAHAFQLQDDLDRLPTELSFSQRRMVTTARAAALMPSVLLLDEPAAGMSDLRRRELAEAIRRLAVDHGMAVVVVDHDMPFVMGLCHHIVVMNNGVKIADGPPEEVRADPGVIAAYLRGGETDDDGASEDSVEQLPRPAKDPAQGVKDVLVTARSVAVGYTERPVVEGIDLQLHRGEVLALLGANRVGKTTLLMCLAGALQPMTGEVTCLGQPVTGGVSPRILADRGLAFLTDDRAVFHQLTVRDNLRVGKADVKMVLRYFPELEALMRRKVGVLSGGEQQMVGLGRALARYPKVMLIDEMSLGLAPAIVRRLMDVLRAYTDEYGVGSIVVEQHVPEALRIADNVCVLAEGRMTLSGSVADVHDRVDRAFLADVLGTGSRELDAQ
jgi:ABC-type branched-subunit amino acid transport system ATPase component